MMKRLSIISTAVLAVLLIAGLALATTDDSSSSSSSTTSTTLTSSATGLDDSGNGASVQASVDDSENRVGESANEEGILTAPSDGVLSFAAGEAGTVQLTAANGALELVGAAPSADWTVADIEIEGSREINVEFRNGAVEIEFKAEVEDGMIKTRIRTELDNDSSDDSDDNSSDSADDDSDDEDDRGRSSDDDSDDEDHHGRSHDDDSSDRSDDDDDNSTDD
jgi:hypothetical protein